MMQLTAERLRELLDYSIVSGRFYWRTTRGGARSGSVAGTVCKRGYVRVFVDGRQCLGQRLAFLWVTGEMPSMDVDHKNGDKSNNGWINLRDVSTLVNTQNQRAASKNNKLGMLGVSRRGPDGKFFARIRVDGGVRWLGCHATPGVAHEAYLAAKRELHEGCTI